MARPLKSFTLSTVGPSLWARGQTTYAIKIDLSHFDNDELGGIAGDSVLLLFRVGAPYLTKRLVVDILYGDKR